MNGKVTKKVILGLDEVGRGPWAGPLVVGAVILGEDLQAQLEASQQKSASPSHKTQSDTSDLAFLAQYLTDSKKLSPKKRAQLDHLIQQYATITSTGWVTAAELDQVGLAAALRLASRRAVKAILKQKSFFSEIVIDGTVNFLSDTPLANRVTVLKKADLLIPAVSAASIIAKVARDRYMTEIARQYPAYGFEKHVGYGTAFHKKALLEQGICPEHRQSFRPIREILAQNPQNLQISPLAGPKNLQNSRAPSTSQKGQTAELAVASYLLAQNHQILAQNSKTKIYEIDLISTYGNKIFFTEVKYSQKSTLEGTPLVRITSKKQDQMQFAAKAFLNSHPEFKTLQPLLAVAAVSGTDYRVEDWFVLE